MVLKFVLEPFALDNHYYKGRTSVVM